MTKHDTDVEGQLPLPPAVFHILIALGEGERHGYAVMQEVTERTGGKVRMSPGTLYGSIRKMLDEGLIEELFRRGAQADDERRRYYRVTKFGRAVAFVSGRVPRPVRRRHGGGLPRGAHGRGDARAARRRGILVRRGR
jgi:DNA-binding MarR family transcriptional regulator